jgi:hypothetical protein
MKNIILCADDYGQNPSISQAIIQLAEQKSLSAISCLTTSAFWAEQAKWLIPYQGQVDLGLHFNLTEGKPLSPDFIAAEGEHFVSLPALLGQCYGRRLNRSVVVAEFHAQLDQFITGTGRLPDFIDGHQHIHQLPGIRDWVIEGYMTRLRQYGSYVRSVYEPRWGLWKWPSPVKRLMIQLCGAAKFQQLLVQYRIPHNSSFAGVYSFNQAQHYSSIFPLFLQQVKEGGLIMCHPGLPGVEAEDPIMAVRPFEYRYFQSEAFREACQIVEINLVRFVRASP